MNHRRILAPLLLALCASAALPVAAAQAPGKADRPGEARPPGTAELLVGNKSAASVWRLDLADGSRKGEVATGQGPHEIAVAPDRRSAVVADYGSGAEAGNTLTVIDLGGGASRTVALGDNGRPHGLRFLPGGQRLVATTEDSNVLLVVDLVAGVVERAIDLGPGKGHMVALSADGGTAYVSKVESGHVVRVDLAAAMAAEDDAARAAAVRQAHAGAGAEGIDVAPVLRPDGRHGLLTSARAATLWGFGAVGREALGTVGLEPEGVELHGTMLGRAALPIGAIADPAGGRVFVAISGADRIAVIDTATWTVSEYWETGREPDALGIVAP